ncbi:sel1 repeat family protein [Iodobacter sp. HSC-16F04]|uniref:Sel1 repeat family protein n=1 Tax=Iodobacter violaceini TaxID=3044271 RepID=A0ABX0KV72_9NEIS|nr:SEL1-like repeat protein [Iodobacter violacea]NHQ88625.1 sel1 repeat family protein [Iodobacter violacea]
MWIVVSLSNRDKITEALPYAKIALEHAEIADDDHIVALLNIIFKHPEFTPSFVEAVKQSALSRETIAARILYALFCDQGLHGFERNPAIAGQWFQDAQQADPQNRIWDEIISAFTEAKDYLPAALLAHKGQELNNDSASFQLAYLYDEGLGVKQDTERAIELYQKLTDSCQLEAQSNLFVIFRQRLNACRTKDERHAMEKKTLDAIIQVEQLGSDNASYTLHRLCSTLHTPEIIAQILPRLQEEATQGVPEAMAALAAIFGSKKKGHYHYHNSVLWLMACEACDPENPLLEEVKETVFENSFFGRIKLAWVQAGIEPHQLPGADNNMV